MKFVDFCAGIGGGRLGLQKNNLNCVAFSEIDSKAEKTYRLLYDDDKKNYGDLMNIKPSNLPEFDIMIAGFPCQSFSIVGKRKGLDDLRGQIIYGLIDILISKNTPYFILENVKGLVNHKKGNTMKIILEELNRANYEVSWKVLNSIDYGVPQMRERVYIVGIRKDLVNNNMFVFPQKQPITQLKDFLIDTQNKTIDPYNNPTFQKYLNNKYNKGKFNINNLLKKDYLVLDTRQSDLRIYENKIPTLRKGRHGILYTENGILNKLSGFESLLLQGFPKDYAKKVMGNVSEGNLLSQAGNAMTVSTISAIARQLIIYIKGEYNGQI